MTLKKSQRRTKRAREPRTKAIERKSDFEESAATGGLFVDGLSREFLQLEVLLEEIVVSVGFSSRGGCDCLNLAEIWVVNQSSCVRTGVYHE